MSDLETAAVDSPEQETDAHQSPAGNEMEHPELEGQAPQQPEAEQPQDVPLTSPEEEAQERAEEAQEAEESEVETLQAELEEAQAQAAEYLDGWQRARAEFANYKKRVEAEREELRRTCNEALLLKLLPIVDDFERAFQTLPEDLADIPWVDGMAMILRKLQSILEGENVTPIEATGHPFDPVWHEAVMQEETTEHPDGYICAEMQRGYRLGERVLRPSMVKVAINTNESDSEEE
jgi:molecular chaperone GrpE